MPLPRAVLIDVYETVLTVDMRSAFASLVAASGRTSDDWHAVADRRGHDLTLGTTTMEAVFAEVVGDHPDSGLVADLVSHDAAQLREHVTVFDDVVPTLTRLREAGVRTAYVSNCNANTRPLLEGLGLADLVDHLTLSCEVHAAKPEAAIFHEALGVLGVAPEDAVLVDDKAEYCDAARALGLGAVQIERHDPSSSRPQTLPAALGLS